MEMAQMSLEGCGSSQAVLEQWVCNSWQFQQLAPRRTLHFLQSRQPSAYTALLVVMGS